MLNYAKPRYIEFIYFLQNVTKMHASLNINLHSVSQNKTLGITVLLFVLGVEVNVSNQLKLTLDTQE